MLIMFWVDLSTDHSPDIKIAPLLLSVLQTPHPPPFFGDVKNYEEDVKTLSMTLQMLNLF